MQKMKDILKMILKNDELQEIGTLHQILIRPYKKEKPEFCLWESIIKLIRLCGLNIRQLVLKMLMAELGTYLIFLRN